MGNANLALEYRDPVLEDTLGELCVALLGGNSAVHQRLEAFWSYLLLPGLFNQFLHQCTCALGMALEYLNPVLKDTLGECQITLLGGNCCIREGLACFLGGFD